MKKQVGVKICICTIYLSQMLYFACADRPCSPIPQTVVENHNICFPTQSTSQPCHDDLTQDTYDHLKEDDFKQVNRSEQGKENKGVIVFSIHVNSPQTLSCPSGKLRTEFTSLIVKYPLALGYLTLHVLSLNARDHKNVVVLTRQYFMLEQKE